MCKLRGLFLVLALMVAGFTPVTLMAQLEYAGETFVELDAADPTAGSDLWEHNGVLEGFEKVGNPFVQDIDGVPAVTFNSDPAVQDAYQCVDFAPEGLVGVDPTRSIEAWVWDDAIAGEETIVSWGKRGGPAGTNMSFNLGTNVNFGAIGHWGAPDIGWGTIPALSTWNHLVYTYDGTTTRVYVNGEQTNTEELGAGIINTFDNTRITVASQIEPDGVALTGGLRGALSISRLRIHDEVLTADQVRNNFVEEAADFNFPVGEPTFTTVPTDDIRIKGTTDYSVAFRVEAFPFATVEVIAPAGATIEDGVVSYAIPNGEEGPITFTLRATNDIGTTDATWNLSLIDPPVRADVEVAEELLVHLDASDPTAGTAEWENLGVMENFERVGNPSIISYAGALAVNFNQTSVLDSYQSIDDAPEGVVGPDPTRSIEAWVYNNDLVGEETIVSWGWRGGGAGSNMSFNYGDNINFGAIGHWGAPDIGWGTVPELGRWNHLVYTYDGTTTRVYVNAQETNSEVLGAGIINTHTPSKITLAAQIDNAGGALNQGLRGALAIGMLRVHDGVLTPEQIRTNFDLETDSFPVPGVPPEFTDVPAEGAAFIGSSSYTANVAATGFPPPLIEVISPEGASVTPGGTIIVPLAQGADAAFDVTVRASNKEGSLDSTWTVNRVDPVFLEFDDQAEFDEEFFDPGHDTSARKGEVTATVNNGALEIFLPGVDGQESFDHWCAFDRTPRWLHNAQVTGVYQAETQMSFVVPPPNIGAEYHLGLSVDRGFEDLAQFGPIRNGIEYERNCSKGGENTGTFFGGMFNDPLATVQLRIIANGEKQSFFARPTEDDPWTLVSEVNGPRPNPVGIGFSAKNWGTQGDYTAAFDYFSYGPPQIDILTQPPESEDALRGIPYVTSIRSTSEGAVYEIVSGPEGATIDENGDLTYDITEPAGTTIAFEVSASEGASSKSVSWEINVVNSVLLEFDDAAEIEEFEFSAGDGTAGGLDLVEATIEESQLRIFIPGSDPNFDQWCGFDRTPRWIHNTKAVSSFDIETKVSFDAILYPTTQEYHVGLAIDRGLQELTQFGLIREDVQRETNCDKIPRSGVFFADTFNIFDAFAAATLRIEKRGLSERYLAKVADEDDWTIVQETNLVSANPIGVGLATKSWGGQGDFVAIFDYFLYGNPSDDPPPGDEFRRGDTDGNGALEITDPINNLSFQFLGTFTPPCLDAADFDDNGKVEITDPIANLSHQFLGTAPPAPPGKETCGLDPTPDDPGVGGDLGCINPPDNC